MSSSAVSTSGRPPMYLVWAWEGRTALNCWAPAANGPRVYLTGTLRVRGGRSCRVSPCAAFTRTGSDRKIPHLGRAGGSAGGAGSLAAGYCACGLCDLVGVSKVKCGAAGDAGRAQGRFPAANFGLSDSDGEEEIRQSDVAVVEEICGVGLEIINIKHPAAVWNRYTELMFFVLLAVQWNESEAIGASELQQRA